MRNAFTQAQGSRSASATVLQAAAANEDRRIAVVNDVGRFLRREMAIDAGEVRAR